MTSQAITLNAGANGNQTSTANMIELEGVEKVYRTDRIETVALTNVNLSVRAGEFISIMGPSGSGKSTLLNVIGLLDVPTGGKVTLNNQPVTSYSDRHLSRVRNEQIGFVFQTFHLINDLSVVDNVEIPLLYRKNLSGSERRKLALRALDRVGLHARVHHFPSQLSGGQQQRVALARTLVIQPRVLLLDEPLSNLDAKLRQEMRIELLKLQRDIGLTTLYVTHDQEEALTLSTRIAVMNLGKVIQEGKPREIYESPRERFVATFVGKSNFFSGTIVRSSGGLLEIQTEEGFNIKASAPPDYKGAADGHKVVLYVRPEAIDLVEPADQPPKVNRITGRVAASAYQGSLVEYEIESAGRLIRVNDTNPRSKPLFQRGDETTVTFAPEDVRIVSE